MKGPVTRGGETLAPAISPTSDTLPTLGLFLFINSDVPSRLLGREQSVVSNPQKLLGCQPRHLFKYDRPDTQGDLCRTTIIRDYNRVSLDAATNLFDGLHDTFVRGSSEKNNKLFPAKPAKYVA